MKKIVSIGISAGIFLFLFGSDVFADHTYNPKIRKRITRQQERIYKGIGRTHH